MNNKIVGIAAALILVLLLGAVWQSDRTHKSRDAMTLPSDLKFSHKFHVKDQGIACADCHTNALSVTKSTERMLGSHEQCGACHSDQVSSNCSYCHTDSAHVQPTPKADRELIFSHATHAGAQKLDCATCHGGIDTVETVRVAALPSMSQCTECHEQKQVSIQCETCHSDVTALVPDNHLRADFRRDHKRLVRAGTMEVSCAECHEETFCQDCHTGTELRAFAFRGGLMADPLPVHNATSSARQLRVQAVHTLNYRFTHGVDAHSKQFDCASCHDRQQFCSQCHEGGTVNQARVRPASHNQPGFTTLGKGSGGGLHAQLGRRDIEACASCHDVQGADPVCSTCHGDNGSVR